MRLRRAPRIPRGCCYSRFQAVRLDSLADPSQVQAVASGSPRTPALPPPSPGLDEASCPQPQKGRPPRAAPEVEGEARWVGRTVSGRGGSVLPTSCARPSAPGQRPQPAAESPRSSHRAASAPTPWQQLSCPGASARGHRGRRAWAVAPSPTAATVSLRRPLSLSTRPLSQQDDVTAQRVNASNAVTCGACLRNQLCNVTNAPRPPCESPTEGT